MSSLNHKTMLVLYTNHLSRQAFSLIASYRLCQASCSNGAVFLTPISIIQRHSQLQACWCVWPPCSWQTSSTTKPTNRQLQPPRTANQL